MPPKNTDEVQHRAEHIIVGPIRIPLAGGAPLLQGTFVARPNRLVVNARLDSSPDDAPIQAHIADRGRLLDLLRPGARLLLARHDKPERKTRFQVVAVQTEDDLVSLDTHLPNRLIATALGARALPQFARYPIIQAEAQSGSHRFDFRLREDNESLSGCLVEVKSVGHVRDELALFPDAPTERGRMHVEALAELAMRGQRAALLFVVQRSRGRAVVPNDEIDPRFAFGLRKAIAAGVEVYAYRCPISLAGITLGGALPVFGSAASVPSHG